MRKRGLSYDNESKKICDDFFPDPDHPVLQPTLPELIVLYTVSGGIFPQQHSGRVSHEHVLPDGDTRLPLWRYHSGQILIEKSDHALPAPDCRAGLCHAPHSGLQHPTDLLSGLWHLHYLPALECIPETGPRPGKRK